MRRETDALSAAWHEALSDLTTGRLRLPGPRLWVERFALWLGRLVHGEGA